MASSQTTENLNESAYEIAEIVKPTLPPAIIYGVQCVPLAIPPLPSEYKNGFTGPGVLLKAHVKFIEASCTKILGSYLGKKIDPQKHKAYDE